MSWWRNVLARVIESGTRRGLSNQRVQKHSSGPDVACLIPKRDDGRELKWGRVWATNFTLMRVEGRGIPCSWSTPGKAYKKTRGLRPTVGLMACWGFGTGTPAKPRANQYGCACGQRYIKSYFGGARPGKNMKGVKRSKSAAQCGDWAAQKLASNSWEIEDGGCGSYRGRSNGSLGWGCVVPACGMTGPNPFPMSGHRPLAACSCASAE